MQHNSKAAVYTLQHDETFFLPMWIKYYSQHFNAEDMYILAHNCNEETEKILQQAEADGINVKRLTTTEIFNHEWLNEIVEGTQKELLQRYEYAVYTDCDEFICPTNMSLRQFIDAADGDAYRCVGWNVIEDQICRIETFDKTLISRVPIKYSAGYHVADVKAPYVPTLHLYHLHRINYKQAWERTYKLSQKRWDPVAVNNALSWENRIDEESKFKTWFYASNSLPEPYTLALTNMLKSIGYKG